MPNGTDNLQGDIIVYFIFYTDNDKAHTRICDLNKVFKFWHKNQDCYCIVLKIPDI